VTGSLKFDMAVPDAMVERGAALRTRFAVGARCGSPLPRATARRRCCSTDGAGPAACRCAPAARTEASAALRRGLRAGPGARLACVRRSSAVPVEPTTRVVLGDSLGEMLAYCAAADVAFVGGRPCCRSAGRNLLEPIAVRRADAGRPAHVQFRRDDERAIEAAPRVASRTRRRSSREVDRLLRNPRTARRCAMRQTAFMAATPRRGRSALGLARAAAIVRTTDATHEERIVARRSGCEARGGEEPERTRSYVRIPSPRATKQVDPAADSLTAEAAVDVFEVQLGERAEAALRRSTLIR